jgi:hypothetical protein
LLPYYGLLALDHIYHTFALRVSADIGGYNTIIDVSAMFELWGNDENASAFSVLIWRQAVDNFVRILEGNTLLTEFALGLPTYASQMRLHGDFFKIEQLEAHFDILYPLERELRLLILKDGLFDSSIWASRTHSILDAHRALASVSTSLKRPLQDDSYPSKASRTTGRNSFRPFREEGHCSQDDPLFLTYCRQELLIAKSSKETRICIPYNLKSCHIDSSIRVPTYLLTMWA